MFMGIETGVPQKARDQVAAAYPEQKTPALDARVVGGLLDDIRRIPKDYREGYGKQPAEEDGTPFVGVDTYGIKSENPYWKYANTTPQQLIAGRKLEGVLKYTGGIGGNPPIDDIKFDNFSSLSDANKRDILRKVSVSMGFTLVKEDLSSKDLAEVRDVLILAHNNARLREHTVPQNIEVRKDVAERLAIAQRYLRLYGLTLGVGNGLRTSEFQRLIKENHENFRGKSEADRLFASEDASPHLSGGAVDVYLMRDGKRVDLKLGNNSPETKSPLFVPDSPTQNDQEIVQLRHVLLDAMTRAGFAINPTEYWHFSYGDAMWAYMTQQTTGTPTTAMYGPIK